MNRQRGPKLRPCLICGHEVSTEALHCPSCGQPNPTGSSRVSQELERLTPAKTIRIALGVFVGLLMFAVLPAMIFLGFIVMGAGIAGVGQ